MMNEKTKHIIICISSILFSFILGATICYFIINGESRYFREQLDSVTKQLNRAEDYNQQLGNEIESARIEISRTEEYNRELTDNLKRASEYNRELTESIGECKNITDKIGTSVGTNISTIEQCIEVVRSIRIQVKDLQNIIDSCYTYNCNFNNDYMLQNNEMSID